MSDPKKPGLTYRDAGVDIDAQEDALRRIKAMLLATRTKGVLADLGSFGGMFQPDLSGLKEPVLVASCDGVGTKLKVAFMTGIHDTVGRDLVNHCVNDILVQGASPLFFMDYVATGRLSPEVLASIVAGVATGCRENGCALLGGETAEMPGFYAEGTYDLAGFIVGLADKSRSRRRPRDPRRRCALRVSQRRASHQRLLARAEDLLRGRGEGHRRPGRRSGFDDRPGAARRPPLLPQAAARRDRRGD